MERSEGAQSALSRPALICARSFARKGSSMKLTSEEMRSLYQRQTARSIAGRGDCLLEDVMTRAAAGELSRSERGMIADHLAVCSDCAQEYRILRRLKPSVTTQLGWARRLISRVSSTGPCGLRVRSGVVDRQPEHAQCGSLH